MRDRGRGRERGEERVGKLVRFVPEREKGKKREGERDGEGGRQGEKERN